MSYIAPNSDVFILRGVSLDRNYQHTLYQESIENQFNKIANNHIKKEFNRYSYQRAGKGKIRVEALADDLYDCNYMAFRNTAYGNKWFYAFIDSVEYINDNCTEISYTIDVMQTWYFDYDLGQCFVEREHTLTDNFGENVIPEDINGNFSYISNKREELTFDSDEMYLIVNYLPNNKFIEYVDETGEVHDRQADLPPYQLLRADVKNKMFMGYTYYGIGTSKTLINQKIPQRMLTGILNWCSNSENGSIINIVQVPKHIFEDLYVHNKDKFLLNKLITESLNFKYSHKSGSYAPKNKKLYIYPYKKIEVSNNKGKKVEFRWELFKFESLNNIGSATFQLEAVVEPSPDMSLFPKDYKNIQFDYENEISYSDYPEVSWSVDSFSKWWSENKSSWSMSILAQAIIGIAAAYTGLGIFAASSFTGIAQSISQLKDAKNVPDNIYGVNSYSPIPLTQNRMGYYFYEMGISGEEAKVIDDYFSMFGYAIKEVKIPNIKSANPSSLRPTWNYIKTQECVIHASAGRGLPAEDEEKIAKIYNNGITFWNDLSKVGNYNENNAPRA